MRQAVATLPWDRVLTIADELLLVVDANTTEWLNRLRDNQSDLRNAVACTLAKPTFATHRHLVS